MVRNLSSVLRQLGLPASGKKIDQQNRLCEYLATGVRVKDYGRVANVCRIVISEMNQSFPDERDRICCQARVPELRHSLSKFDTLPSSLSSSPSSPSPSALSSTSPSLSNSKAVSCSGSGQTKITIQHNGIIYHNRAAIPDVTYKPSPFYKLLGPTTAPIVIPQASSGTNKFVVTINYQFSAENAKLAKQGKIALLLMSVNATETKDTQEISTNVAFPYQTAMAINGKAYTESLRGLKGKPGTTRPADITKYTNKSIMNTVEVHISEPVSVFVLRLYLASPVTVDTLVKKVVSRQKIKKEDTTNHIKNRGIDDDIEELSIVVNIKCPIAGSRIQTPVRSVYCSHFECFDLTSFILLQQQATTWRCPICNEVLKYEDLAIDEYMEDVLENVKAYDITEVEFLPDGTWKKPENAPLLEDDDYDSDTNAELTTSKEKSKFVPAEAEVILLDSDDDEPVVPISSMPGTLPISTQIQQQQSSSRISSSNSLGGAQPSQTGQSSLPSFSVNSSSSGDSTADKIQFPEPPKDFSREELFKEMPTWGSSLFGHRRPRSVKPDDAFSNENHHQAADSLNILPPLFSFQTQNSASKQLQTFSDILAPSFSKDTTGGRQESHLNGHSSQTNNAPTWTGVTPYLNGNSETTQDKSSFGLGNPIIPSFGQTSNNNSFGNNALSNKLNNTYTPNNADNSTSGTNGSTFSFDSTRTNKNDGSRAFVGSAHNFLPLNAPLMSHDYLNTQILPPLHSQFHSSSSPSSSSSTSSSSSHSTYTSTSTFASSSTFTNSRPNPFSSNHPKPNQPQKVLNTDSVPVIPISISSTSSSSSPPPPSSTSSPATSFLPQSLAAGAQKPKQGGGTNKRKLTDTELVEREDGVIDLTMTDEEEEDDDIQVL